MKRAVLAAAVAALLLAPLAVAASPPPQRIVPFDGRGVIRGTVLGPDSQPVRSAEVYAMPVGGAMLGMEIPWAETDQRGEFTISRLPLIHYQLSAGKPSEGYADGWNAPFYRDSTTPSVALTPAQPKVSIIIRLGVRPAILIGAISDAQTGAPIRDAGMTMTVQARRNRIYGMSIPQSFRVFMPSNRPVAVEFHARGYKPLRLNLQLAPGVARRLKSSTPARSPARPRLSAPVPRQPAATSECGLRHLRRYFGCAMMSCKRYSPASMVK